MRTNALILIMGLVLGLLGKSLLTPPRPNPPVQAQRAAPAITTNVIPSGTSITFTWDQMESNDYRQYIKNLKAVNCPWETIKDIIIADVNKLYAPKFQVFEVRPLTNVWIRGSADLAGKEMRIKQLKAEKHALLVSLLGEDIYDDVRELSGDYALYDTRWDFLPKEKRQKVQQINETYTAASEAIYGRSARFHMAEDDEENRKIESAKRDALSALLTPAELEQYDMRNSQLSASLRLMDGADLTETEFVKAFRILREADQMQLSPQVVNERLKEALGEDRYNDYHRAENLDYRDLARMTKRFELPNGTAAEIWASQQESIARLQAIARDPDLDNSQKAMAKSELLNNSRQALLTKIGPTAFRAYTNDAKAGKWLR